MTTNYSFDPVSFDTLVRVIANKNLSKTPNELLEILDDLGEDEVSNRIEAMQKRERIKLVNLAKQYVRDCRQAKKDEANRSDF